MPIILLRLFLPEVQSPFCCQLFVCLLPIGLLPIIVIVAVLLQKCVFAWCVYRRSSPSVSCISVFLYVCHLYFLPGVSLEGTPLLSAVFLYFCIYVSSISCLVCLEKELLYCQLDADSQTKDVQHLCHPVFKFGISENSQPTKCNRKDECSRWMFLNVHFSPAFLYIKILHLREGKELRLIWFRKGKVFKLVISENSQH